MLSLGKQVVFLLPLTDGLCNNIFYSFFLEDLPLKIFFLLLEKC